MIFASYTGRFGRELAVLCGVALYLVLVTPAVAHLMVAQRGTLNLVGDGVYMVLSLPVSAFVGIDDDGDGKMSAIEFNKYRAVIADAVNTKVQLQDRKGVRPLVGLMLSPVMSHDAPQAPTDQLVVMGKFLLMGVMNDKDADGVKDESRYELNFRISLFGREADEQVFTVTAKDPANARRSKLVLVPEQPGRSLFVNTVE